MSRALLMDTHIWLWFALGVQQKLNDKAVAIIETAASEGRLYVSVISVWEISLLVAKGRIHLGQPTSAWITRALAMRGLKLVSLEPEFAIESNQLPGEFHQDPVDRILVASARCRDLTLLTRDQKILRYAEQGYVVATDPQEE